MLLRKYVCCNILVLAGMGNGLLVGLKCFRYIHVGRGSLVGTGCLLIGPLQR